ncbi:nucleotide exchange factor GrpE [Chromatium okenii]|uniref:nucleotide exchange factor GrpE n=1 Tax=Chromatium okenii TaxID=61644 RepID=UPI0026EAF6D8|nr:nucleotide exchange factor GrpE [Chromatium okenii]MBV5308421.1 nucleotide exchange factor GrpE [Chromatium okenii]
MKSNPYKDAQAAQMLTPEPITDDADAVVLVANPTAEVALENPAEPVVTAEELAAALVAARTDAEAQREQVLRVRAELENIRRRHVNELEKAHKFALEGFARELLQVRDSLELGHQAALDATANVEKLREGTELTLKLLGDVMEKFGVTAVDPLEQPFDPAFHQAISMQPRADVAPNTVVAVVQKGYVLNGRLVRPAMVLVSSAPS